MSYDPSNPYATATGYEARVAALASESERTMFIRRTYSHLAGAIAAFIGLEVLYFNVVPSAALENAVQSVLGVRYGWLLFIGAFIAVSFVAERWANSTTSLSTQYLGLGLYVFAESLLFLPLLFIATRFSPEAIPAAGIITGVVFAGLTGIVFLTRADFSWMGRYLCLAALTAFGVAIASMIFGFTLGNLFAAIMVAIASGYILYDTSNVLHRYQTTQHVAAALALFASVALLFWYVLRLVMALSSRD